MKRHAFRRTMVSTTAIPTATAVLAGLLTVTTSPAAAASVVKPKPTSPAAAQAPYVSVKHRLVLNAMVKAGAAVSFTVKGIPGAASAAVLSLTVPAPTAAGTIAVYPYGSKRPSVVNLSFAANHGATATAVVPSAKGRVSLYNGSSRAARVRVTVVGYYAVPGSAAAASAKTRFVPVRARRLASVVAKPGGSTSFATKGLPTSAVSGVVLSVTVSRPLRAGAVAVYPSGSKAGASSFGFKGGRSVTTLLIVKPGARSRIALVNRSKAAVRVWADVVGYLHTLAVPSPPRGVTAAAQNGGALVSWTAPATDGGAPVAGYQVRVLPGGATVLASSGARVASIGGLHNGTPYTFVVVARNSAGSSLASVPSQPVIPYGVPAAPTGVAARATDIGKVTVSWTAPTDSGGLPITGYKATASPGGVVTMASATSVDVSGLTSGQVYTFRVATLTAASSSVQSAPSGAAIAEGTSRVSVAMSGEPNNVSGTGASFSADGRYVAFTSTASNLTADDKNMYADVFVRDRLLDTTTLVSVPAPGVPGGSNDSGSPSISADGRYVAFQSAASNLVSPPTAFTDIFVRDLVAGTTRLVSATPTGQEANGNSSSPAISADGSAVVFTSGAAALVPGGTAGFDVYVATLATHSVVAASVSSAGTRGLQDSGFGVISGNGRYVAFDSLATNLTSATTGGYRQVYLRDLVAGTTTLVSEQSATAGGNGDSVRPSISNDGSYVAFQSSANDLPPADANTFRDVYVRDTTTHATVRVSRPYTGTETTGDSTEPSISADGRFVAFDSDAGNLVPGDTNLQPDVFRLDRNTGATSRVSTSNAGVQGDGYSHLSALSPDGQHVAFYSAATTLVDADRNGYVDEFVRDLG
ncbi:MAG: hypothetical protein QOE76_640 [Frankiales bacterium]|nr:hypothetical protein [Frankiales bacterium]